MTRGGAGASAAVKSVRRPSLQNADRGDYIIYWRAGYAEKNSRRPKAPKTATQEAGGREGPGAGGRALRPTEKRTRNENARRPEGTDRSRESGGGRKAGFIRRQATERGK